MSFGTIAIVWYLIGVFACFVGTRIDLNRGLDFTTKDLVGCSLLSIFGPIALVFVIVHWFEHYKPTVLVKGKQ